jgi:hypothetical protein
VQEDSSSNLDPGTIALTEDFRVLPQPLVANGRRVLELAKPLELNPS